MEKKDYQMMIAGIIGIAVVAAIISYQSESYLATIIVAIICMVIVIGVILRPSK